MTEERALNTVDEQMKQRAAQAAIAREEQARRARRNQVARCSSHPACREIAKTAFSSYASFAIAMARAYGRQSDRREAYKAHTIREQGRTHIDRACANDDALAWVTHEESIFGAKIRRELLHIADAMRRVEDAETLAERAIAAEIYDTTFARFLGAYGRPEYWYDAANCNQRGSAADQIRSCSATLGQDEIFAPNFCKK